MNNIEEISQSQKERLSYIDFVLFFLGQFNRSALESRFGIKQAAATRDIAKYKEIAADNLVYIAAEKRYVVTSNFEPQYNHRPVRILAQLSRGFGGINNGKNAEYISCELPYRMKYPAPSIIAPISRAIYQKKAVAIQYVSTSSGKTNREIVPFALVDNGLRWHVRAFDRKNNRFCDFVLSRIIKSMDSDSEVEHKERKEHDDQWNRMVELRLVPHPNQIHQETICHDYDMVDGVLSVNVRAAIAGYLLRRLNVDCTEDHSLKSPAYQLWLSNLPTLYGVDTLNIAPGLREV
jgi:hypothetical protein